MLTIAAVKAARPRAAGYKIFDERGLHLYVAPNGKAARSVHIDNVLAVMPDNGTRHSTAAAP
jgi:hypothetical protein